MQYQYCKIIYFAKAKLIVLYLIDAKKTKPNFKKYLKSATKSRLMFKTPKERKLISKYLFFGVKLIPHIFILDIFSIY